MPVTKICAEFGTVTAITTGILYTLKKILVEKQIFIKLPNLLFAIVDGSTILICVT